MSGLDAFNFRQEVKRAGSQDAQFKLLKEKAEGIEYLNYSYPKLDSLYADVNKAYDVNIEVNGDEDASMLYIYPMVTERMTKNPFSTQTREYPVDFGVPFNESYKLNFIIPDGYQVEELPISKSIVLNDKVGTFTYKIGQMDKRVVLDMRLSADLRRGDRRRCVGHQLGGVLDRQEYAGGVPGAHAQGPRRGGQPGSGAQRRGITGGAAGVGNPGRAVAHPPPR